MERTVSKQETKALLKEALVELLEERQDLFLETLIQALEDVGLAHAIREGRKGEFVSGDAPTERRKRFLRSLGAWQDERPIEATLRDILESRCSRAEPRSL